MRNRQHRTPSQRDDIVRQVRANNGQFYHVNGRPVHWERERAPTSEQIDHIWITIDVKPVGLVRAAISTESARSRAAGVDPRVRIGLLTRDSKPAKKEFFKPAKGLDYAKIEQENPVEFQWYRKAEAEKLLLDIAARASQLEIWGHAYMNRHLGIHNIHSLRPSCAAAEDDDDGDGAMLIHSTNPNQRPQLLMLKFCGQP